MSGARGGTRRRKTHAEAIVVVWKETGKKRFCLGPQTAENVASELGDLW